jgi:16S rRNA processing protein RimM
MNDDSGFVNGRKQSPGPMEAYIAIGIIRKPVGLKGQCYTDALGVTFPALAPPVLLYAGRDPSQTREIVLKEKRQSPKGFVCRFEGFNDIDTAGTLRGMYLFCSREALPRLPEGKHYHFELEGLAVVADETGTMIGTVTEVQQYPTTDALEVRKEDGSTVLVSMTKGIVKSVDIALGVIRVSGSALEEIIT